MIALLTLFLLIVAMVVATRLATVALTLTGMSAQAARFQARSALSGVGFTTSESEQIVNHPARRRVVMFLMLVGSAGLVTGVATLSVAFVGQDSSTDGSRVLALLAGCVVLLVAVRSRLVDAALTRLFAFLLSRFTDLDLRDYAGLLHLSDGHSVLEVVVRPGGWLASAPLEQLDLRSEGLTVLGIEHSDGRYESTPATTTALVDEQTVVVYGVYDVVAALCERPAGPEGDRLHSEAVRAHTEGWSADPED